MKLLTTILRRFSYKQGYKDAMTEAKALVTKNDLYVLGLRKGFSEGWEAQKKGLKSVRYSVVGLGPGVTVGEYEAAVEGGSE